MARVDCWSCKYYNNFEDQEMVEKMLLAADSPLLAANACFSKMPSHSSYVFQKQQRRGGRWYKLQRSITGTVSALTSALAMELQSNGSRGRGEERRKAAWNGVVESLMQRHPGSQLPERLISMIRRHFESLPSSYAQAGFDSEQVFTHIRLIEQARLDPQNALAVAIQQQQQQSGRSSNASELSSVTSSPSSSAASWDEDEAGNSDSLLTFACVAMPVSKQALSWAFKRAGIAVKHLHVYERKSLVLGIVSVHCSREFVQQPGRMMQAIVKSAAKRSRLMKLTLGLYGPEGSNSSSSSNNGMIFHHNDAARSSRNSNADTEFADQEQQQQHRLSFTTNRLSVDGAPSSLRIRIDDRGNVLGKEDLAQWSLDPSKLHVLGEKGAAGDGVWEGRYGDELVALKQLNLLRAEEEEDGGVEFEFQKEVLALCSVTGVAHKNVLPIRGVSFDGHRKIWVVSKFIQGGSLDDLVRKRIKLELRTVLRIACDVAEGMQFLHECGIIHSNLKTTNILLDDQGSAAVIGGVKIARMFDRRGERIIINDTSTSIHQHWQAPEVSGVDFENSVITPKTDVYSFGIVLWELITCHMMIPFPSSSSSSEAAAGLLKPMIPVDCFPLLKYLLQQCWTSNPLDRPDFCEILEIVTTATRDLTRSSSKAY